MFATWTKRLWFECVQIPACTRRCSAYRRWSGTEALTRSRKCSSQFSSCDHSGGLGIHGIQNQVTRNLQRQEKRDWTRNPRLSYGASFNAVCGACRGKSSASLNFRWQTMWGAWPCGDHVLSIVVTFWSCKELVCGVCGLLGMFDSLFFLFLAHVLSSLNISKLLYWNFSLFRQPWSVISKKIRLLFF